MYSGSLFIRGGKIIIPYPIIVFLLTAPVPAGALPTLLDTWTADTSGVYGMVFTPDGRKVITASNNRSLWVWETASGKVLEVWDGHTAALGALAIGPDGRKAVSGSENGDIRVWDVAAGKTLLAPAIHTDGLGEIAVSPDNRTAASTSFSGELRLWDIDTGRILRTLQEGDTATATTIAFSPDGKKLAAGQVNREVWLWDVEKGERLSVCKGHRHQVLAVAFSPDGSRVLSGSRDNTARLWDARTGDELAVWRGHTSSVNTAVFSPDGRTAATGGGNHRIILWDVPTGGPLAAWRGHQDAVRFLRFSPDGDTLASAGEDFTIKLWDLSGKAAPRPARKDYVVSAESEVDLGAMLFNDTRLSGDNSFACPLCHNPAKTYADGMPLSLGYPETLYFRNAPTLLNAASQKLLYLDGRFSGDDLPSLIVDHLSEAHFMGADGRLIVEKLRYAPGYVEAFARIYGGEISYKRVIWALTAYLRTLKSGESPYDRFQRGDTKELSRAARRGYKLFNGKAGCARCHSGPLFTDGKLHDRRVPENPEIWRDPLRHITFRRFLKVLGVGGYGNLKADPGHFAASKLEDDRGKFRTPGLRDAAGTAPYMHNGTIATLEEAVAFENPDLSEGETKDVAEFLRALTGQSDPPPYRTLPPYERRPAGKKSAPGRTDAPYPVEAGRYPPLGPLPPVRSPEDNPSTPEKVELGRSLFYDPRLSGNGDGVCVECHEPMMGWGDGQSLSPGYTGTLHWRNTQTLLNTAYYDRLNWDGSKATLEEQARGAITSNLVFNGDPALIEERLAQVPEYVRMFKRAFGVDRPYFEGVLKALAAFQRTVPVSRNAPFDRYAKGDRDALSPAAVRGMALFNGKAGCIRCHNGPLASDQGFYALGVPRNPDFDESALRQIAVRYQHILRGVSEKVYRDSDSDPGLYFATLRKEDGGKFRTPSLRDLKYTAPYMHNGVFTNLGQVVDFYDAGSPAHLDRGEKADLIAFLESLSGDEITAESPPLHPYAGGSYP